MSNTPWTDALITKHAKETVNPRHPCCYPPWGFGLGHADDCPAENLRRIEREHAQMLDVLRRIRIALADVLPEDNAQDKRQDGGVPYFQFD